MKYSLTTRHRRNFFFLPTDSCRLQLLQKIMINFATDSGHEQMKHRENGGPIGLGG